jgi:site-specific DNA-cytosine methylase
VSLLCGHSEPFSQTWPNWGTTRAGTAYAQPTWEHLTADSGSSSSPGLPTPTSHDWKGPNQRDDTSCLHGAISSLLPTPTASDRFGPGEHGDGGMDLRTAVDTLLPTPRATDGTKGGPNQRGSSGDLMLPSAVMLLPTPTAQAAKHASDDRGPGSLDDFKSVVDSGPAWGPYEPAIRRWERRLGRTAPAPTEPGSKGQPRLSPAFVEFMMGLPAGWVTDVPGLSRNDQLKALGNGVVPQQAAAAVRFMLARLAEESRWAA